MFSAKGLFPSANVPVSRAEAAVSSVNNIKSEVNAAKAQADAAAQAAQDVVADVQAAVASVENKADKSYVDNAVAGAFDNLTAEQKAELKGETGAQGPKGDSFTYSDFTPEQLAALKGADGQNGTNGVDGQDGENGKSAYEVAVANGYNGTVEAWLNSLKGADGQNGSNGADGQDGHDGKSAFELAQEAGFTGTKEEWLESLKGEPGEGLSQADRELIESLAELGESDFATGSFPTGANVDDQSADENGLATVQDVMDYVNAFFEKKKDELEPGEAKDYFYVNGVEYVDGTETLTSIYQMNCFEIGEEVDLSTYNVAYTGTGFALEVKINSEIYGFLGDGGVNDPTTIYSELFTVDVPNGYTLEVHQFDPISGGYAEAVQSMMSNPKGATKHYGSKTYNSYARYTTDLYGEGDDPMCVIASPARYLIIIKK